MKSGETLEDKGKQKAAGGGELGRWGCTWEDVSLRESPRASPALRHAHTLVPRTVTVSPYMTGCNG